MRLPQVVGIACLLYMVMLPVSVQAQFTFTTNADNTITIMAYTGRDADVAVPDTINGLPVTSIGDYAFYDCLSLTNVTIGTNVTGIGNGTFFDCLGLTSVTIPNGVTSIGVAAFGWCGLSSVMIPNSVTSIGNSAFDACGNLASVTLSDSVTNLGDGAFEYCPSLTSIVIPNSVARLGVNDFYGCASLTNVAIPNSITNIGDVAFAYCTSLTSVTIPCGVTSIGNGTFEFCTNLEGIFFNGNAPSFVASDIFYDTLNVTVYYLPGTTGWDTTFAGRPTAFWLLPYPTILNFEPDFGVQTNSFGFTISWATNLSVVVEASTNLSNPVWQPVQTNLLTTGSAWFSDPQWTNYPARFYRLRSP